MASQTCGCGVGSSDVKCRWHALEAARAAPMAGFCTCDGDPRINVTCGIARHRDEARQATTECGFCEGHGYTIQSGKVVECDRCSTRTPLVQVGWYGPYGIIPGGMDNDPAPHWRPIYVLR